MPYYRICPDCGAYLDFGERCDFQDEEKAAPVLQHRDGQKVKVIDQTTFTSILQNIKEEIKNEYAEVHTGI